jgi:UPF0755 protein
MLTVRMLDTRYRRSARHRARRGTGSRRSWGPFIGLIVTLALVGAAALAAVGYYQWCLGAGGPQEPVSFVVPEGATGSEVVDSLHEEGVIRCDLVSKFVVRQRGHSDEFIAGTYELTTNMELDEVLTLLTTSNDPVKTFRFTTPEGFTVKQIGAKAADELGLEAGIFSEAGLADDRWSLPPYLPRDNLGAEGFLFPRSYEFVVGTRVTPKKLIRTMLAEFEEEVAGLPWQRADRLGRTRYEIVIIASMIEEETAVPEERALVSAVIYNRLEQGGPLGIDATLMYVDPNPEDGLTDADLAIDSPYNTRLYAGLPPTPISNPGAASIRAALEPADSDFLYYVLCPRDGEGVHRFSKTLAEHNANVADCLG